MSGAAPVFLDFLLRQIFDSSEVAVWRYGSKYFIQFRLDGGAVPVLRIPDDENHQERHDVGGRPHVAGAGRKFGGERLVQCLLSTTNEPRGSMHPQQNGTACQLETPLSLSLCSVSSFLVFAIRRNCCVLTTRSDVL